LWLRLRLLLTVTSLPPSGARAGGLYDPGVLARIRAICMAFPEVTERPSHGAPSWFVRDKHAFVTLWEHGHHDDSFPHLWCAGLPGAQEELVLAAPDRIFRPPYANRARLANARCAQLGPISVVGLADPCFLCLTPVVGMVAVGSAAPVERLVMHVGRHDCSSGSA